ncbi:medium-chain dehydrogenase/reductase like protein [Mycena galopus ATCC 62051]|nr:medium-chain dehydrogenase/reductase like protein [Mycena galopus ATCC 62051]
MTQQQAIIVHSPKAPFVIGSRDIPSPAKGEVVLKVMSVGLNPMNPFQRELGFLIDEYPVVLGGDLAGTVESIGEGVEGFKQGDRVCAQALSGGFQQYATVCAATLIRIPDNASFDEVATFPITFATACVGLFAPAPIGLALNPTFSWDKPQQGESALVIGGSTSVGQFAIQLLKFLGFTRIVAYASKVHFDYLRQLGATECIDRGEVSVDSLAAHPALAPPVKVVYDIANGALNAAYDCVAEGGSIVTAIPPAVLDRDLDHKKSKDIVGYLATPDHTPFGKLVIKNLPELLEKKIIVGNRYEVLPHGLAGILEGLERWQKGTVSGAKLVGHPQDPTA